MNSSVGYSSFLKSLCDESRQKRELGGERNDEGSGTKRRNKQIT